MEEKPGLIETLFERAETYSKTSLELFKLRTLDKSSDLLSSLVSRIAVITVVMLFLTTLNIGVSLWLGEKTGKFYFGFFMVAAFYALAGLVLYLFRNRWIKTPVGNSIIKEVLN